MVSNLLVGLCSDRNAQIEFLLRRALQDAGRLRKEKSEP
jgi:hypothetical protein